MKRTVDEQCADIAEKVARRYKRRCWWADREELEQQAWIAILEVKEQRFGGDPIEEDRQKFGNYAWRHAMRRLSRWLWQQSSPVSARLRVANRMRGMTRVSIGAPGKSETGETGDWILAQAPELNAPVQPDDLLIQADLIKKIRTSARKAMSREPGDEPVTEAVIDCVMGGLAVHEAAAKYDVPMISVRKRAERFKKWAREDRVFLSLCAQLAAERGWLVEKEITVLPKSLQDPLSGDVTPQEKETMETETTTTEDKKIAAEARRKERKEEREKRRARKKAARIARRTARKSFKPASVLMRRAGLSVSIGRPPKQGVVWFEGDDVEPESGTVALHVATVEGGLSAEDLLKAVLGSLKETGLEFEVDDEDGAVIVTLPEISETDGEPEESDEEE